MKTLRVLVVDDEPWIRAAVARDLQIFSTTVPGVGDIVQFEVAQAESGEEAIEVIAAAPPHIVLLDLKLPGIDGLEVLDQVCPKYPDMLVIMISAYASIESAVRATKSGAYDFLAKPFTPEELEHVIRKAANHIIVAEQARDLETERRQVRFQFISVLAHELKSPLNAIEGFLTTVIEHNAGDNPAIYQEMLRRSVARLRFMRKMIVDLLDLTRIESGQRKRDIARIGLGEVARATVENVMEDAAERHIAVTMECPDDVAMEADRSEIEILLNNLVSNAVKYNREAGRVTIRIERAGDVVHIAVSDTGIGMSPEESARLFNDFVRIKNEKTFGIPGSGLGLSIVKKIAVLYGGNVTVESVPGEGSVFRATLRDAVAGSEKQ